MQIFQLNQDVGEWPNEKKKSWWTKEKEKWKEEGRRKTEREKEEKMWNSLSPWTYMSKHLLIKIISILNNLQRLLLIPFWFLSFFPRPDAMPWEGARQKTFILSCSKVQWKLLTVSNNNNKGLHEKKVKSSSVNEKSKKKKKELNVTERNKKFVVLVQSNGSSMYIMGVQEQNLCILSTYRILNISYHYHIPNSHLFAPLSYDHGRVHAYLLADDANVVDENDASVEGGNWHWRKSNQDFMIRNQRNKLTVCC